jgi:hypothetical protein
LNVMVAILLPWQIILEEKSKKQNRKNSLMLFGFIGL